MAYTLSQDIKYSARYSYTTGTSAVSRTISGINIAYINDDSQTVFNPSSSNVFELLDDVMGASTYTISKRYFVNEREVTVTQ